MATLGPLPESSPLDAPGDDVVGVLVVLGELDAVVGVAVVGVAVVVAEISPGVPLAGVVAPVSGATGAVEVVPAEVVPVDVTPETAVVSFWVFDVDGSPHAGAATPATSANSSE